MSLVQTLEIVHDHLLQKGFHLFEMEVILVERLYDVGVRIILRIDPKGPPIRRPRQNMTILALRVDILQHGI